MMLKMKRRCWRNDCLLNFFGGEVEDGGRLRGLVACADAIADLSA